MIRLISLALLLSACTTLPADNRGPLDVPCDPAVEASCTEWTLLDFGQEGRMFLRPVCLEWAGPRDPFFIPDEYVSIRGGLCVKV